MKKIIFIYFLLTSNLLCAEWEKFFSEDKIDLYRRVGEYETLPFKAIGTVDYNIDKVLMVLIDYKKKHLWSPKLKSVKMHKILKNNVFLFSEYYKTPWPATDREFLLRGSVKRVNNGFYELRASSIEDQNLKDEDHIQAEVRALNITLEKLSENKTKMTFEFHGDMKGWMPVWLINLIQKKWPFRFIQSLRSRIQVIEKV